MHDRLTKLYFFFQAEDGIRDTSVTGVQTCALPICHPVRQQGPGNVAERHAAAARVQPSRSGAGAGGRITRGLTPCPPLRSEERRVGKECRYRGRANQEKKQK